MSSTISHPSSHSTLEVAVNAVDTHNDLGLLHTSRVCAMDALESRFTTLSTSYSFVSQRLNNLATKHDALLDITIQLCAELGTHARNLEALQDWVQSQKDSAKTWQEIYVERREDEQDGGYMTAIPTSRTIAEELAAKVLQLANEFEKKTSEYSLAKQQAQGPSPSRRTPQHAAPRTPHLSLKLPARPDNEDATKANTKKSATEKVNSRAAGEKRKAQHSPETCAKKAKKQA